MPTVEQLQAKEAQARKEMKRQQDALGAIARQRREAYGEILERAGLADLSTEQLTALAAAIATFRTSGGNFDLTHAARQAFRLPPPPANGKGVASRSEPAATPG